MVFDHDCEHMLHLFLKADLTELSLQEVVFGGMSRCIAVQVGLHAVRKWLVSSML